VKKIFYSITLVALFRLILLILVGSVLVLVVNAIFESILLNYILVIVIGIFIILHGRKAKKKHDFNIIALKKIGKTIVDIETVSFKSKAIQGGALIDEHTYIVYALPTKQGIEFNFPSYNSDEIFLVKWGVIKTIDHCFYNHKGSSSPLLKIAFNCSNIELYIPWKVEFNTLVPNSVEILA
jgi:hypothetical protein